MYTIMQVLPITLMIIMAAVMVTPLFIFATYTCSGASFKKGAIIAAGFLVFGGFMSWVCLAMISQSLGLAGTLIVPICWITPSLILFLFQSWFLDKPLSQHFLISLQLWRVIGALFLLEMVRGNLPGIFAYPAGIGDIIVAIVAALVLLKFKNTKLIPSHAVTLVIACGIIDFLGAFFFGFFSSPNPLQIFFPTITNNVLLFPTGMIPLFLVPYAIFFHALSWLNLRKYEFR